MAHRILLILLVILTIAPATATAEQSDPCEGVKIRYVESSARKLYRALGSKGFKMLPTEFQPWLEIAHASTILRFSVHEQHDGVVAGLVSADPTWSNTYVVAMTDNGPLVVSHTWPSPGEVADGQACRPVQSHVAFPTLEHSHVDVAPFKFWGLRVVWRLPADFSSQYPNLSATDAVSRVVRQRHDSLRSQASR